MLVLFLIFMLVEPIIDNVFDPILSTSKNSKTIVFVTALSPVKPSITDLV